jgi:hypothetical protein
MIVASQSACLSSVCQPFSCRSALPPNSNQFQQELEAADYELDAWRASSRFVKPTDFAALDADGGAGWELARDLLRPRDIVVAADGAVDFVASSEVRRISAADALKHRCGGRRFRGRRPHAGAANAWLLS